MNKTIPLIFLLLLTFASCEKVDLPTEEKPQPDEVVEDTVTIPVTPPQDTDSLSLDDIMEYVEYYGLTEETAFSVHDVLRLIPPYLEYHEAIGIPDVYVCGFIVGFITKNKNNISHAVFATGDVETNIVIADSIGEKDYHNCIAIQLSTGTKAQKEIREGLNLSAHPENLGRFVILHGNIAQYMGTLGLKSVNDAVLYTE